MACTSGENLVGDLSRDLDLPPVDQQRQHGTSRSLALEQGRVRHFYRPTDQSSHLRGAGEQVGGWLGGSCLKVGTPSHVGHVLKNARTFLKPGFHGKLKFCVQSSDHRFSDEKTRGQNPCAVIARMGVSPTKIWVCQKIGTRYH